MFIIYGGIFFPQILKPQVINNEHTNNPCIYGKNVVCMYDFSNSL